MLQSKKYIHTRVARAYLQSKFTNEITNVCIDVFYTNLIKQATLNPLPYLSLSYMDGMSDLSTFQKHAHTLNSSAQVFHSKCTSFTIKL